MYISSFNLGPTKGWISSSKLPLFRADNISLYFSVKLNLLNKLKQLVKFTFLGLCLGLIAQLCQPGGASALGHFRISPVIVTFLTDNDTAVIKNTIISAERQPLSDIGLP